MRFYYSKSFAFRWLLLIFCLHSLAMAFSIIKIDFCLKQSFIPLFSQCQNKKERNNEYFNERTEKKTPNIISNACFQVLKLEYVWSISPSATFNDNVKPWVNVMEWFSFLCIRVEGTNHSFVIHPPNFKNFFFRITTKNQKSRNFGIIQPKWRMFFFWKLKLT